MKIGRKKNSRKLRFTPEQITKIAVAALALATAIFENLNSIF
ncbi:MAG: hypothetical protein ACLR2J_06175 [Actinomyces sp.]|jgi:hypothetical protein|nr:hypothetical protein [Isoptericola variabilis]